MIFVPTELIDKSASEDNAAIANAQVFPIARIGRDAPDGYGLCSISLAAVVLQLVYGIFFCLCNLACAIVDRVDGMNVVGIGIDFGRLVDEVNCLVATATQGIGKIVEARVERVFLVLDLCERILCCG